MILLADESVDAQIVERLRQNGYEVSYVAEMEPGIPDELVFDRGNQANAVLVTADKDFGEIVFRDHRITSGVVLIRLTGLSADAKADVVATAFTEHRADFPNCFSVISPNRVRIRARGTLRDALEK